MLIVSTWPVHTVAAAGLPAIAGETGWATTTQLIWFNAEVVQPNPVAVLRLWMIFVPVTAAKFGTVVDQALQVIPLSVEY
jgi:hypothetical protein